MRGFFRVWLTGYVNPAKLIAGLKDKPAPHWGFYAHMLRAAMDSFLLYLPLFLLGRTPPTPSYLSFIATASWLRIKSPSSTLSQSARQPGEQA